MCISREMTAHLTWEKVLERLEGDGCELLWKRTMISMKPGIYGYMAEVDNAMLTLSAWQLCAVKGAECWGKRQLR